MRIISRNEARLKNLTKYFTYLPCKKGHLVERYTNTGACVECISGYYRKKNGKKPIRISIRILNREDIPVILGFIDAINLARKLT